MPNHAGCVLLRGNKRNTLMCRYDSEALFRVVGRKTLGVAVNMLYKWEKLHEHQVIDSVLAEDEHEKLKCLHKEIK